MFRIFAESVELAQLRRVSFSEGDQHGVVAACEHKKVRYATLPRTDGQFVLRRLLPHRYQLLGFRVDLLGPNLQPLRTRSERLTPQAEVVWEGTFIAEIAPLLAP
jgi:hypothetical protein